MIEYQVEYQEFTLEETGDDNWEWECGYIKTQQFKTRDEAYDFKRYLEDFVEPVYQVAIYEVTKREIYNNGEAKSLVIGG